MSDDYEIPLTKSLPWSAAKSLNFLVGGTRGMGKSFLALYLTRALAQLSPPAQLYAIDPKNSDFGRLASLLPAGQVATQKDQIFNLLETFVDLMHRRIAFINQTAKFGQVARDLRMPLYYLIFDEFAVFSAQLDTKERKKFEALVSSITLLGRAANFGIIAIMQQIAVGNSGFNSAWKEQFGAIAHMGAAHRSAYRQTFGEGIALPDDELESGEGFIWLQGLTNGYALPFMAPYLNTANLWSDFEEALANQNDTDYLFMYVEA
ncbi:hypothetical protein EFN57_06540 [Leuconostoc citreum]|nr:hypothetical protein [Leuconostoc citreum]MCT3062620.1 hypothetical protein [Leuconostoc citreum]